MPTVKRRYSKREIARRGEEIYASVIEPRLAAADRGNFAAVDIETGEYELDPNELAACDRLRLRIPDAQIWIIGVGSRDVHRFGGRE